MNFISAYMDYCRGNEAPENYHLWSCLSTLSSLVSRKVWLNQGIFRVYCNLYVVLVGPPGNKKTTAMSIAKRLIREIGTIPFSAECETKEALVLDVADKGRSFEYQGKLIPYAPMSVFVTELSQFIGPEGGHMIDFLVTIFDQDFYDRKTATKGSQTIAGPYLSLLACTTNDWVSTYLRSDIISGGFSRRTIFANETDSGVRIPFPELTPEQTALWEKLLAKARDIQGAIGEFSWTSSARNWYSDWYTGYKIPDDPLVSGYHRTKHIQLLKVAMLFAVADDPTKLVISSDVLILAKEALERIEPNMLRVFQGVGRNELSAVTTKVLELLQTAGGVMSEKQLRAATWNDASGLEFSMVIDHLMKTEKVVTFSGVDSNKVSRNFIATLAAYESLKRRLLEQQTGDQASGSSSSTDQSSVHGQSPDQSGAPSPPGFVPNQ